MDAMPAIHEFMSQEFGNFWAPIVSGEISSHAIDRAPIASSRTPFPVVTFSHGLGSTGFQYTVLIEYLVSHGYVVASIEHTYTAKAIWFPDGRVIGFGFDGPIWRPPPDYKLLTPGGQRRIPADVRCLLATWEHAKSKSPQKHSDTCPTSYRMAVITECLYEKARIGRYRTLARHA
jgi:hypothetical protein